MSEKIDYDAYLKQLGDIDTNQKNRLKTYLEEQCKYDDALKACYVPEKMDDCYEFFKECYFKMAQKDETNAAVVIEDAVGYKIARDYFIEILPALSETTDDQSEQKAKTENKKAKTENKKAEKKNKTEQKAEEKPVDVTPVQEVVKEVSEQVETDAASDNVKRSECGFEVFGEDEEPEEAEKAAPEPCHQDEVGTDVEDLIEGCRFDSGLIIDRPGRRLMFKDLFRGLHFVHADDDKTHLYLVVCAVTYIDANRIRFRIGNDNDFGCRKEDIDGEHRYCDQWLYAIPSDAKAVGKLVDGVRTELDEDVTVPSYDSKGNGLLFGF